MASRIRGRKKNRKPSYTPQGTTYEQIMAPIMRGATHSVTMAPSRPKFELAPEPGAATKRKKALRRGR